jgi:hypothetical protein
MYTFIRSGKTTWTVGYYSADGTFNPDSDWYSPAEAAHRVDDLNGSYGPLFICGYYKEGEESNKDIQSTRLEDK